MLYSSSDLPSDGCYLVFGQKAGYDEYARKVTCRPEEKRCYSGYWIYESKVEIDIIIGLPLAI